MKIELTPKIVKYSSWLIVCGLLGAIIGEELGWGGAPHRPLPKIVFPTNMQSFPQLSEPFKLDPPDRYLEAFERPLFVFTRRPPPPGESPMASQMRKGKFRLTGVAIVDNKRVAFLLEITTGKTKSVVENDTINEIKVAHVHPQQVVLTQGTESEQLDLKIQPSQKVPVATTTPVPVASAPAAAIPAASATPPPPANREPPPPPDGTKKAVLAPDPSKEAPNKAENRERLDYMRSIMGGGTPPAQAKPK